MQVVIYASQIKADRAILDWSQKDMANLTGLGENTIRRLEEGTVSPRDATNSIIRQVIENHGLELIEGEGIRRRSDGVKVFKGRDAFDQFADNVVHTVKKKSGDIIIMIQSVELLARSLGLTGGDGLKHLDKLTSIGNVKCLFSETPNPIRFILQAFECRITQKETISPTPYFIYGDKYANALLDFGRPVEYVIFHIPAAAESHRDHFSLLWDKAIPFVINR